MATKAKLEISLKDFSLATGQYIILSVRTQLVIQDPRALLFQFIAKRDEMPCKPCILSLFLNMFDRFNNT